MVSGLSSAVSVSGAQYHVLTLSDWNECDLKTDNCDPNSYCTNTVGSFVCTCNTGYTKVGSTCTIVFSNGGTLGSNLPPSGSSSMTVVACNVGLGRKSAGSFVFKVGVSATPATDWISTSSLSIKHGSCQFAGSGREVLATLGRVPASTLTLFASYFGFELSTSSLGGVTGAISITISASVVGDVSSSSRIHVTSFEGTQWRSSTTIHSKSASFSFSGSSARPPIIVTNARVRSTIVALLTAPTTGNLMAFGFAANGQLGLGSSFYRTTPTMLGVISSVSVVNVAAGSSFVMFQGIGLWLWLGFSSRLIAAQALMVD